MARVSSRLGRYGKEFSVNLSRKESAAAGLDTEGKYEFVKARPGLWVLLENAGQAAAGGVGAAGAMVGAAGAAWAKAGAAVKPAADTDEGNILSMLRNEDLAQRVEGKFEKRLDNKELKRFNEMLAAGMVEKFRLSPKYKKAVYRIPGEGGGQERETAAGGKHAQSDEGLGLEKDGYISVKSENLARRLSEEFADQIRAGEIRGMRSFDGNFYIAKSEAYMKHSEGVLGYIQQKGEVGVEDIAGRFKLDPVLVKIICEFLREDAEITEKRRGFYKYIG